MTVGTTFRALFWHSVTRIDKDSQLWTITEWDTLKELIIITANVSISLAWSSWPIQIIAFHSDSLWPTIFEF